MTAPNVVYLVLESVRGLGLGLIVIAPIFRIELAGFGPLELVLAGTALEVAYFLSEIPTGIIADVYSRRLSVILAGFVMGSGWLMEGLFPRLVPIMIAQALLGVGWTFFSGATEAWITSELGTRDGSRAIVRGRQASLAATVAGMFVGAAIGSINLRVPIVIAGFSHLALALFLIGAMKETPLPRPTGSRRGAIAATLRGGARTVRRSRVLPMILAATLLAGAASEGVDRLWEAHLWLNADLPKIGSLDTIYWFAFIGAGGTILSVIAISASRRWLERESDRVLATVAIVCAIGIAAGTALFGLTRTLPIAIVLYWAVLIGRNVDEPAYILWIVRNSPPELRATIISMEGQSHSIGEISSGPALGSIGKLVSIPAALVVSGLLQALAIPFLALGGRGAPTESPTEATPMPAPAGTEPGDEPLHPEL